MTARSDAEVLLVEGEVSTNDAQGRKDNCYLINEYIYSSFFAGGRVSSGRGVQVLHTGTRGRGEKQ